MSHQTSLIATRALSLIAALIGALVATRLRTLAKVAAFFAVKLLAGKQMLRRVLNRLEQVGSDELLVAALGAIALGVAYCAVKCFGASFALGAFVAGLVLNGSDLGEAAAKHPHTLQNALVVLFFVAVGILFDPTILVQAPLRVLAVVAVIVIGKFITALALALVFRLHIADRPNDLGKRGADPGVFVHPGQLRAFSAPAATRGAQPDRGGRAVSIAVDPLIFRLSACLNYKRACLQPKDAWQVHKRKPLGQADASLDPPPATIDDTPCNQPKMFTSRLLRRATTAPIRHRW